MINNEERRNIIIEKISQYQIHIDIIESDIINNPGGDVQEKPSRLSVMQEYIAKKQSLEQELAAIDTLP